MPEFKCANIKINMFQLLLLTNYYNYLRDISEESYTHTYTLSTIKYSIHLSHGVMKAESTGIQTDH